MTKKTYQVLFICTGNSARSIMAEAILNQIGAGRFQAYSAGSQPIGQVHPLAIRVLKNFNHDTSALRSKNWHEFTADNAPRFDFVFTVCDKAAGEPCPVWPGQPMRAHWGVEDPAMFYASDLQMQKLFVDTYFLLKRRIELFYSLPLARLDAMVIQHNIDAIGLSTKAEPQPELSKLDYPN